MFNTLLRKIVGSRSKTVVNRIMPYIKQANKIIDIGSGTGDVANLIKSQGKNITPVDVANFHGPRMIKTIIYDGKTLPFKDQSFDMALLLMVMHHTSEPDIIFKEAIRVAKKVVVIETSYTTSISRILTIISDAIGNLRLNAFWNSYKTDVEWRQFFTKYAFKIDVTQKFKDKNLGFIPFLHILYFLTKKSD